MPRDDAMVTRSPPFPDVPATPRGSALALATKVLVNALIVLASLSVLAGFLWMVFDT